jgi:hypothetical protein
MAAVTAVVLVDRHVCSRLINTTDGTYGRAK